MRLHVLLLGLCVFLFIPHVIIRPNSLIKNILLHLTIPWFIYDQLWRNCSFYIKTKTKTELQCEIILYNTIFFFQWIKIYSICIHNIAVPTLYFALLFLFFGFVFFSSLFFLFLLFSLLLFLFVCLSYFFLTIVFILNFFLFGFFFFLLFFFFGGNFFVFFLSNSHFCNCFHLLFFLNVTYCFSSIFSSPLSVMSL